MKLTSLVLILVASSFFVVEAHATVIDVPHFLVGSECRINPSVSKTNGYSVQACTNYDGSAKFKSLGACNAAVATLTDPLNRFPVLSGAQDQFTNNWQQVSTLRCVSWK